MVSLKNPTKKTKQRCKNENRNTKNKDAKNGKKP